MRNSSIGDEAARAQVYSRQMIDSYVRWGSRIQSGKITQGIYMDILDFVNFRIETADSCLLLIENRRIGDALGLCRSLLEHYLLLMLMCRGFKSFQVQDLSGKSGAEVKKILKEEKAKLASAHAAGEQHYRVDVRPHPKRKDVVLHVFEGLVAKDEPDFRVPFHYFHHQGFEPEAMRLKSENYFVYHESELKEGKVREREYRKELELQYRYFLSYEALILGLKLNELLDDAAEARLEAHYTFLGKFLHPTHEAARRLHDHNNYYTENRTTLGMGQRYSEIAVLLASLYIVFCLSGILGEAATLIENAPARYIVDPGTSDLRPLLDGVPREFPYFWFLFNEAPLWDKFNYAIHHASDADLATYGHYRNVPSHLVSFEQDIYRHLESALSGWSNRRCGTYKSPLG